MNTDTSNRTLLTYGQNFGNLANQLATVRGMDNFLAADLNEDDEPLTGLEQATVAFHHNNFVHASPALALLDLQRRNQDLGPQRRAISGGRGQPHRSVISRAVRGNRLVALHATKGWRDQGPARG